MLSSRNTGLFNHVIQQQSPDILHIGHWLIHSLNGEPNHGGKAPRHNSRATHHGNHEQNGGANGPWKYSPSKKKRRNEET